MATTTDDDHRRQPQMTTRDSDDEQVSGLPGSSAPISQVRARCHLVASLTIRVSRHDKPKVLDLNVVSGFVHDAIVQPSSGADGAYSDAADTRRPGEETTTTS